MPPDTSNAPLFDALLAAGDRTALAWQLAGVVLCLVLSWVLARFLNTRLTQATHGTAPGAKFGLGSAQRLLFPLLAVCFVAGIRLASNRFGLGSELLNIAVPLLGSLAIIRAVVYLLHTAFDEAPWLVSSERALAWTVWTAVALHVTGVLPDVLAALDALSIDLSGKRLSVLTVIKAMVVVAVAVLLGLWVGRLIERRLMKAGQIDVNVRVVLSRLIRVLLMVLAVLVALPALGIDITVLSVFSGALGVGIGFGLQKVASNYVSGFTILLDRSITPGAMVTIDQYYGQVTRVAARYVVVRGLDGTEAIVPNETVVTSVVINHSFSDPHVRVELDVQIGYRSDVERALATLIDAARAHPKVLPEPAPIALLGSFGDSGINLRLFLWIDVPEAAIAIVQSDIYRDVWRQFKERGIEIPYPQREVRLLPEAASGHVPSP